MSSTDLGPLDWRMSITDSSGRPTPEFQRRWNTQRINNGLIGVTLGSGVPPTTPAPADGAEYVDISTTPGTLYVGSAGAWVQVGVVKFTQLTDTPHAYTGAGSELVRVNSGATGLEFTTPSTVLDGFGAAQGDILYRGPTGWTVLAPGNPTQLLQTGGASANPSWVNAPTTLPSIPQNTLLANTAGTSSIPIATTISTLFDAAIGSTQGEIIYRNNFGWTVLNPGTSGQFLATGGAGANPSWQPGNVGTVTSVGLTAASIFTVTGSPITTSGSLALGLATENANLIFAGPASGAAATPTFRSMVTADIPDNTVTLAKLATQANLTILSNISGAIAVPSANTLSAILDASFGSTQGGVLFRGASAWQFIGPGTNGQVLTTNGAAANPTWLFPAGARPLLASDITIFVATTGNDSNSGLTSSVPVLTGQRALNILSAYDLNTHTATIQFADGTYPGAMVLPNAPWQTGTLIIQGNMTTPANVIFSLTAANGQTIVARGFNCVAQVQGITFNSSSATHLVYLLAQLGGVITYTNCAFKGLTSFDVYANNGGLAVASGPCSTTGNRVAHIRADTQGRAQPQSQALTITGTPTYSSGFVLGISGGTVSAAFMTFTGTYSGPHYNLDTNAVITTNGAGENFFPGTTVGVKTNGGQYS